MAVDPNIALGVRGVELTNPLAQYGQVVNIQNAQNQNAMARMQMEEYARTREEEEKVRNYLAGADLSKPETRNELLKLGKSGAGYAKILTEQEKAALERDKIKNEVVEGKLKQSRQLLENVTTPEEYLAWHQGNHADPVLGPLLKSRGVTPETARAQIEKSLSEPGGFQQLLKQSQLGIEKFTELNKPQLSTKDIGGSMIDRTFEPLTGKITDLGTTKKTATPGEVLTNARALENIAISKEKLRREGDPLFQQAMANAQETGKAIAKGDVQAKQALPKILSDAQMAIDIVDQMVGKQEVRDTNGKIIQQATKPHPGFQNAVGASWLPGARFVPGTDAAGFQALQDQVEGTAFLSAFEALKGGGAISEKEGAKATAARSRMTLAQNEQEYIKAAREFQDVVRKGVETAQRKAGGVPAPAAATPATAPSPKIDQLLQKYK